MFEFILIVLVVILSICLFFSLRDRKLHYDGVLEVTYKEDGTKVFNLNCGNKNPNDIDQKAVVSFKVVKEDSQGIQPL